ncbi:MAG: hypothetical protein ACTMUB_01000 [cyanobacterium endosymbiont of Rhopalodia musculus]|uniref:hypothetical protein n=1 Tax=cyanobacterium endosymbiont of Epithemia clementina EcSB TaxID=3034674 RepID=UPI00247FA1E3|nr:hypothetical protein [cyanobacterium endosymbiont of Epithemia clementina EcSB]WGT66846.1 hypothetical protein P3F56_06210 [cyanobacterium endosymbiont of Epithemia clementina EcSB]
MDKEFQNYRVVCTLEDIYGQIIVWLIVIVLTLVGTLGLWSNTRQIYALAMAGLILVLSLPFLLLVFLTTLLDHIEFTPMEAAQNTHSSSSGSIKPAN